MRRAAKVDVNQNEIVTFLRRSGAAVLICSQLKNAFDILVGYNGRLMMVEIKDGTKPPSARKLTDGELKCKATFNAVNVPYYVVTSVQDAKALL